MELLYLAVGYSLGVVTCYFAFMVGRNTKYQDQNIQPPPSPAPKIELPKTLNEILTPPKKAKKDFRIVGDLDEVDMAAMLQQQEED